MAQRISGPGQGLQIPQYLYPTELFSAPYDYATNKVALSPGEALTLPAGELLVTVGAVSMLQYLDPITGAWESVNAVRGQPMYWRADGFTSRVANLSGCPIAAVVTGGGSGYLAASTTVTASAGGSQWQPIVGGQVSLISIGSPGASYSIPPIVLLPCPPSPGVPATAVANLTGGTVSGVTLTNVGAGYTVPPAAVVLPSPFDPNFGSISQATVVFGLTSAGAITGVICTNNGGPVTTAPTLTAGGAGSGATISAVLLQTVTSVSIAGAGVGYGTSAEVSTVGGRPAAGAYTNPSLELTGFRPRKASIGMTLTAGSLTGTGAIYDGGLFAVGVAPTSLITSNGAVTTAATVALTLGAATDTTTIQQL